MVSCSRRVLQLLVVVTSAFATTSAFCSFGLPRSSNSLTTSVCAATLHDSNRGSSGPNTSFSSRLIESLDLVPLFEGVAKHIATKRGKDAILRLVHRADDRKNSNDEILFSKRSRRETALAATNSYQRSFPKQSTEPIPDKIVIFSIAQSAAEARDEYGLTSEALLALNTNNGHGKEADGDAAITLSLPPIYGGTSPWDTTAPVTTDDDEWLALILAGYAASLEKEDILKADKVVGRLLEVRAWADSDSTLQLAPGLSAIGKNINLERLQELHDEISDSVELVRRRTVSDPSGTKSFSFRFDGDKFPALKLLREKEDTILSELDNSMQELLRNKSFATKMKKSSGRKRSEAFDLDGRLVVSAPRSIASELGVIRGYSKTGGMCFVEPKAVVRKGDQLSDIREEIAAVETEIIRHQISAIAKAAPFVDRAIHAMARIDVIFARAAFGLTLNGIVPAVEEEGVIDIRDFTHPVLALKNHEKSTGDAHSSNVVPIDLLLSNDAGSLIISGPNGGGKTLSLKSFGIVAALIKVGLPLPTRQSTTKAAARVDFFHEIECEVGDQQNVAEGESTLMARLNHMASVINRVDRSSSNHDETLVNGLTSNTHSLVLLDELGSGTDPDAGSAIAQAVLEKIMEASSGTARIVATTHSPQLKALSIEDERFNCASVLLERSASAESGFKRPTFRLSYGIIGDSYALGAASRCRPALPDDVIQRAAQLMTGENEDNAEIFRAMTTSLEREREEVRREQYEVEMLKREVIQCRAATTALARAYIDYFSRLENRLGSIYTDLASDESRSAYDIVGDTLGELRLMKKRVLSQEEQLAQRGLKVVSTSHEFKDGESVVIIKEGMWDGQSASVTTASDLGRDEVAVVPSLTFGETSSRGVIILTRSEVALWDYPDKADWKAFDDSMPRTKSVSGSRQTLLDTLSKLTPTDTLGRSSKMSKTFDENKQSGQGNGPASSKFTSSRERKAANAAAKKEKQRAKKKSI